MRRWTRTALGVVGVMTLAAGGWLGLFWAPPDRDMGDVQRIMYVHVPAVWVALLALTLSFGCAVAYLLKQSWKADALAEAAIEVGLLFGTVGVVLGAIWGKPTWGVWWTWDPRLTTAAIMLVSYTGVTALRRFVEDPERRAAWSAVSSIVAFTNLPIIWFSVRWWRSLHQIQSTPKTVDPDMATALRVSAIGVLLVAAYFVWGRYRLALQERREELAPPEALSTDVYAAASGSLS